MHDHAAILDVEYPVFDDAGTGVKSGFGGEVETEGRVGHLYHQSEVFRPRLFLDEMRSVTIKNDEIWLRLVRWIVFRRDIDGCFLQNQAGSEHRTEPIH